MVDSQIQTMRKNGPVGFMEIEAFKANFDYLLFERIRKRWRNGYRIVDAAIQPSARKVNDSCH